MDVESLKIPETALVGAEAAGGGGEAPAAALVVKFSATAMSRGSYVVVLLEDRYTVTRLPAVSHYGFAVELSFLTANLA